MHVLKLYYIALLKLKSCIDKLSNALAHGMLGSIYMWKAQWRIPNGR